MSTLNNTYPTQTNSVRPREVAWNFRTMSENIMPRVDINTMPPTEGAIAYNTVDNLMYYATGTAWLPLPGGGPPPVVTLGTVPGAVGQVLVGDGIGPDLTVKGLASISPYISVASTATDVTLDFPTIPTLSNAGAGETLVAAGSAFPTFETKALVAGTDISLSSTATDVTITYTGTTGADVTLANAGVGESIVNDGTGPALLNKGLVAGSALPNQYIMSGYTLYTSNLMPSPTTVAINLPAPQSSVYTNAAMNCWAVSNFSTTPGTGGFFMIDNRTTHNLRIAGTGWTFHNHTSGTVSFLDLTDDCHLFVWNYAGGTSYNGIHVGRIDNTSL